MSAKILNIMLAILFGLFCIIFAVKTVLTQMAIDKLDAEWEANRDQVNTSSNPLYNISLDERYN